ncbi:MAG: hypothetical protein V4739_14945 [Pseudomonadota bacterium]
MTARNPYAPPQATVNDVGHTRCTREGKSVNVPTGADLPARCILCNGPVKLVAKKQKVYWHSPWLYLLLLVNVLLYAVVGVLARKSFAVSVGLCAPHAAKRRWRTWGFGGVGLGVAVVGAGLLSHDQELAAVLCFVLGLAGLIGAVFAARTVWAKKITADGAKLGGCKEPFLASLE